MGNYWGVDSCELSTHRINNKPLLNYVTDELGKPDFWGRYIGGNRTCPNGVLTAAEITFLHSNQVKIMVIYNGASSSSMVTEQQGIDDANTAIDIATNLGITYAGHEVIIYLDIEESWLPTGFYLHGWSNTFFNTGVLLPGYYCNTASPNFISSFCPAKLVSTQVDHTVLYTTQPQISCTKKSNAPTWNPTIPICPNVGGVQAWQYKITCLNDFIDLDLMTPYAFERTF